MGKTAPYGSAQRGPTRHVTWTPMAVTWYYRYKDGKDPSMCFQLFMHQTEELDFKPLS